MFSVLAVLSLKKTKIFNRLQMISKLQYITLLQQVCSMIIKLMTKQGGVDKTGCDKHKTIHRVGCAFRCSLPVSCSSLLFLFQKSNKSPTHHISKQKQSISHITSSGTFRALTSDVVCLRKKVAIYPI